MQRIGAAVVWLAVILCPIVLGALDPAFLGLFCAGVYLTLLYLWFVGLGSTSFLMTMACLSSSMLAYWITRGFAGHGLMSD